jgi:hypothetical protein
MFVVQRSILYPKQVLGVIEFNPLEYTIECELVVLTISAQNAAIEFRLGVGKRDLWRGIAADVSRDT